MAEKDTRPSSIRAVEELGDGYYRLTQVAEMLGISQTTLRNWMRKGLVDAPSYRLNLGDIHVYVFTDEDVDELRNYRDRPLSAGLAENTKNTDK